MAPNDDCMDGGISNGESSDEAILLVTSEDELLAADDLKADKDAIYLTSDESPTDASSTPSASANVSLDESTSSDEIEVLEENSDPPAKRKRLHSSPRHGDRRRHRHKCRYCHQPEQALRHRPKVRNGQEESAAVETLQLEGVEEEQDIILFLTNFCFYDEAGHLIEIDSGLVESKAKNVYFDGVVMSVTCDDEDDPLLQGVQVERGGPVTSWWTAGFESGHNHALGVSTTDNVHYYLKKPALEFKSFLQHLDEKVQLTKVVLDIVDDGVEERGEVTYEELLDGLSLKSNFGAEDLIQHAEFIINQVRNGIA